MRATQGYRIFFAAAAALVTIASSSTALAETRSATYDVGGPLDCDDSGETYEVPLPPRAIDIRPGPARGHTFYRDGFPVAEVDFVRARNGTKAVEWSIVSLECNGTPWSIGPQTFTARFNTLSRKPRLKQAQAKRATIRVITAKLNINWTAADRISCRKRVRKNTRTCKYKLLFASAIMRGTSKVALFSRPNTKLYAKVRYRASIPPPFNESIRGKRRVSLGRY